LHISDYDGVDERHWLPGQGIINWSEVVESLVSIDYGGPFMFESAGGDDEKIRFWDGLKQDFIRKIDTDPRF
jgi:sugar phosphate isomerase/epimerase